MIDDLILLVLLSLVVPLLLAVSYHLTEPVPGTRRRRRFLHPRDLAPISRILISQKLVLVAIVTFIGIVRFTGGFPGREWVALVLYVLFVGIAWWMFAYQRSFMKPLEQKARNKK